MRYKGNLAKPRPYRRPPGILSSQANRDAWYEAEWKADWEVLREVCGAHGIDTTGTSVPRTELLFALLEAHVPGWRREKAPRGPKPKWNEESTAELHADVNDWPARKGGDASILQACRALASSDAWKGLCGDGTTAKKGIALSKHFYRAEGRFVRLVRKARAYQFLNRRFSKTQIDDMSLDKMAKYFAEANPGAPLDSVT